MNDHLVKFLKKTVLKREWLDRFFDSKANNFTKFDPELGYSLRNCIGKDGLDQCHSVYTYEKNGSRAMVNYAHKECRINTYGNSFTQCHQVSDGETWQEYLAAHIGEPIRNFGVGGYGVCQSYRRLLRDETTTPAEYILFNIWSGDHIRNINQWARIIWLDFPMMKDLSSSQLFLIPCLPWVSVRLNHDTGEFYEIENTYKTPESLYQLCDPDHVWATFKDDFIVQTTLAKREGVLVDKERLKSVAECLNVLLDLDTIEGIKKSAKKLLTMYSLRASMYLLDKTKKYVEDNGKKFMVLLSYSYYDVMAACSGDTRFDQPFLDYLDKNNFLYIDSLQKHVDDYKQFKGTAKEYADRYFIGHYNPKGNHFFAFSMKKELVRWLDPLPPNYLEEGPAMAQQAAHLA